MRQIVFAGSAYLAFYTRLLLLFLLFDAGKDRAILLTVIEIQMSAQIGRGLKEKHAVALSGADWTPIDSLAP